MGGMVLVLVLVLVLARSMPSSGTSSKLYSATPHPTLAPRIRTSYTLTRNRTYTRTRMRTPPATHTRTPRLRRTAVAETTLMLRPRGREGL